MAKMAKDWKTIQEVLKGVIETLNSLIDEDKAQEEPETAVVITLPEIRAVLANVSRSGKTAEVRNLLKKFNSNKLSEVKVEDYPALMEEAKVLNDAS